MLHQNALERQIKEEREREKEEKEKETENKTTRKVNLEASSVRDHNITVINNVAKQACALQVIASNSITSPPEVIWRIHDVPGEPGLKCLRRDAARKTDAKLLGIVHGKCEGLRGRYGGLKSLSHADGRVYIPQ